MLLVSTRPTSRELRILRNLADRNAIWEEPGRKYFVQFDESTGKEIRIRANELEHMGTCGWIRLVHPPKAAQRLDHYELTAEGAGLEELVQRKSAQREVEPIQQARPRRRAYPRPSPELAQRLGNNPAGLHR
jgi:hypothetical protein